MQKRLKPFTISNLLERALDLNDSITKFWKTIADLHGISLFYMINKSFKRKKSEDKTYKNGDGIIGKTRINKNGRMQKMFQFNLLGR